MKKLVLLLSLALLTACGSGSFHTTPAPSKSDDTSQQVAQQNGTGTVTFLAGNSAAKAVNVSGTSVPTHKRIVISNPALGIAYQDSKDSLIDGAFSSANFTLPIANGYVVEYLEYTVSVDTFRRYSTAGVAAPAQIPANLIQSTDSAPYKYTMVKYSKHTVSLSIDNSGAVKVTVNGVAGSTTVDLLDAASLQTVTQPGLAYPVPKTGTRTADTLLNGKIPSSLFKYGFNNLSTGRYQVAVNIPADSAFDPTNWSLKQALGTAATGEANALASAPKNFSGSTSPLLTGPTVINPDAVAGTATYYGVPVFYGKKSLLIKARNEPASLFTMTYPAVSAPIIANTVAVSLPGL